MMFSKETLRYHHGHDHDHDHSHHHSHGDSSENKDEKTLKILLVHWVNHNESHEEGFREWVEKAKNIGKEETANYIQEAIEYMKKANEMLMEAKKHM
jgi:nickel/cobalt transporter (NicO) family protein